MTERPATPRFAAEARTWISTYVPFAEDNPSGLLDAMVPRLAMLLERIAAEAWNESFKAHQNRDNKLTCAHCGEEFPPGTPPSNHEALTAHGIKCEKSPLVAALAEARRDLAALREQLDRWSEKEAACCPEDVGFDEYIAALRTRLAAVERERDELGAACQRVDDECDHDSLCGIKLGRHECDCLLSDVRRALRPAPEEPAP